MNTGDKELCIEDFELIKNIGKGKFSEVFLGRHKTSNLVVGVKILEKAYLSEHRLEEQLRREIVIQSQCSHPNIVQFYGHFHDSTQVFIIMEYAPKGDLYTLLKAQPHQRFSEPMAAFFINQVLQAMINIHSHGFIHRDLKPENLFISLNKIKIGDFGLAINNPQDWEKKRNTFCGTLDYISPEMFKKQGHDQQIDVWSIGVLTYELVCGKPPFEGNDMQETMEKVTNLQIEYPNSFSQELINFIKGLLQLDPQNRITLQQALGHPWLLNNNKSNSLDDINQSIQQEQKYAQQEYYQ